MMSVFPNIVLRNIFKNTQENDWQILGKVCLQWKNVVDDLWREKCVKNFGLKMSQDARGKCNLSWPELHHSLALWSQINSARLDIYASDYVDLEMGSFMEDRENPQVFQVLNDGTVGYPDFAGTDPYKQIHGCNTIIYFDLETLEESRRQSYNFQFYSYAENKNLIVFRCKELKLNVQLKATKQIFELGTMMQYWSGDYSQFHMFEDRVYFLNSDSILQVSKIEEENGNLTIKTESLNIFKKMIIALSQVGEDRLYILAQNLTSRGEIYSVIGKEIKHVCPFPKANHRNVALNILSKYGFDWSSRSLYKWLNTGCAIDGDQVEITKLKQATVYDYRKVVLLGTSRRVLHIYHNPYDRSGQLNLYNGKPTWKYDLNEAYPVSERSLHRTIEQLDVVEMKNGHKIILLYCKKLVVLEFSHDLKRTMSVGMASAAKKVKT